MAERYGTDLTGLGGFEGGVTSENGAALVSTRSDGETALLFGPAALREIQAGVANGDFAIVPDDSTGTITAENPLPYWTFTDDDSAGAITCAVVAGTAGNSIRWTVAANTTTGKTATLSRYIPVPATRDKAYAFYPEFTMGGATNVASRTVILTMQFYTAALATTGTAITHTYTFNDFVATETGVMLYGDTDTRLQAPGNAAFAKISMAIDTTGTNASASTLDVYEIRLLTAQPMLLVGSRESGYGPAAIVKTFDSLIIFPSVPETWTTGTLDSTRLRVALTDTANPLVDIRSDLAETVLNLLGYFLANPATSTSTVFGSNTVPGEVTSRFQILASGKQEFGDGTNAYDTNLYRSAANTLKTDDSLAVVGLLTASAGAAVTGLIATERASALDEAFTARQTADGTARFALYSNGAMEWGAGGARDTNLYRASAGLLKSDFALAATNISLSGANGLRHDTPATTTQTSSAGIWVLVSGTNYQLRRNSSSARYKTNIVDADEVVLEAARKVKPRHYESTIEDENGATRLGFIAEEIHDAGLTHAVGYDAENKPETIDPTALIAALWHRVNDLEDRLKALEAK